MKTVHMVGNAHLDPAWLWGRAAGADAALATTRSACNLLDEYPEFVFTCSGSWWHQQVERLDPDLFERVRALVGAGRWQPVGGMVIEPDCNLPSPDSFRHQLEAGQGFFRVAFRRPTTVGYNIDSFGHCAYMPRFLKRAGIGSYVFMRPGPHEKRLPGGLFRWQSPDGHEVVAFRIAGSYLTQGVDIREHVEQSLAAMPEAVDHAMCFYGVGDHGGGPSKAQVEWILEHRDDVQGARLVFSHPAAFFDAVAPHVKELPIVVGELQHHAIGCYSVERRIKVAMRRAEARLTQAEQTVERFPSHCPPEVRSLLAQVWEKLLFNQFHDVLDGTSIYQVSRQASGELLWCEGQAEDAIALVTRRSVRPHAKAGEHRIVVFNADAQPFDGWVTHEPW
jgi:alpha-mannosidase